MKKSTSLAFVALLGLCHGINVDAQQLSNAGFEEEWINCIPWTFQSNGTESTVVVGTTPSNWVISNVAGMVSASTGLGSTTVGEKVEGYESGSAVKLTNTPNPFMKAQIVPGYLSLGTTWSTANPSFSLSGITIKNSDGGVFGGIPFTGRPKAIEFMYKRSRGEDKPNEKSVVVAYLWKGHWTQKDVPAIIYMTGNPYTVEMIDRDRCVLGMDMEGCQGGAVSKSEDAELIAVVNMEINENAEEWTKCTATFDYKSDATPEMFNLIIAAGDYFGGASAVGEDNSLIVDDVKLIYPEEEKLDVYPGKLTIKMNGGDLTEEPMDANIEILYSSENECTLTLPNFTLDLGSGATNLGNIVVPNVAVSKENGKSKFVGEVKNMSLMGGAIIADTVSINGTIDEADNADFSITVSWMGVPIDVHFVGAGLSTGVAVEVVEDATPEYFTLQGIRVNADNLTPGIYVVRKGNKVSKVIVK